jgi:hypothetical protein
MLCQTNKLIFVLLLSLPIPSQVKLVKDKWPRSVDRIARMVSCHTRLISAGLNFFIFILCRILFTTWKKRKKELTSFRCWVSVSFTWFGIDERLYISSSANPPLGWLPKRSSSSSQEPLTDENERYIDISDCDTPHRANCSAVKERATNPFSSFPRMRPPLPYNVIIRWLVFFPPILFWLLHRSSCSDSGE